MDQTWSVDESGEYVEMFLGGSRLTFQAPGTVVWVPASAVAQFEAIQWIATQPDMPAPQGIGGIYDGTATYLVPRYHWDDHMALGRPGAGGGS
jgi:hypothetical protein